MNRLLSEFSKLPLGFGGASISGEGKGYGFGRISESEAIDLLHQAKDNGIRLYDTAPIYGFTESEKRIGKAFKSCREDVFIISKSGVSWHEDTKRVNMTNEPVETLKMLENSLRDLQTEYIDLYMIHWPDQNVDIRRPLEVLAKAKLEGKIKHIGLCNTNESEISLASEIDKIEVVQNQLNIFERESIELFPYLDKNNISFMSWGTLDKGIITGRVGRDRTYEEDDCRKSAPWWKKKDYLPKVEKMEKLFPVLDNDSVNGLQLATSFNLSFNVVDMVLVGARNEKQLNSVIESVTHPLSSELLNKYISILDE